MLPPPSPQIPPLSLRPWLCLRPINQQQARNLEPSSLQLLLPCCFNENDQARAAVALDDPLGDPPPNPLRTPLSGRACFQMTQILVIYYPRPTKKPLPLMLMQMLTVTLMPSQVWLCVRGRERESAGRSIWRLQVHPPPHLTPLL